MTWQMCGVVSVCFIGPLKNLCQSQQPKNSGASELDLLEGDPMASRPSRSLGILLLATLFICLVPPWVGAFMQSSTATSTTVSPDNATITLGDTVTFTAKVTATTGTPT